MAVTKPIEILTYGGGAVGAIYSWMISRGNHSPVRITIVCRSNYSTIATSGFEISSDLFGPSHYRPDFVVPGGPECASAIANLRGGPVEFDYILISTKVSNGKVDIPPSLVTAGKTTILLFQNGVGIEEPYVKAFPHNTIISAVLYISCAQPSPGKLEHVGAINYVNMGIYPVPPPGSPLDEKLELIAALLESGGCTATPVANILSDRWLKTVWNGCWNILCVLSGVDTHAFLAIPESRDVIRKLTTELVNVSRRVLDVVDGNGKPRVQMNITMAEEAVRITPSMLQDARKGKEMEVETLCGEVLRQAGKLGVDVPVLR
ncbi:ketopantoate reductase PanE/ApbA C terminal-domain-containing protein [Kalaharituber pfeilii]|nr:ketopantoate reductase PanE/ApbA C terminal-domain-containing protein [Kalaharituber pfeilii]